MHEDASRDVKIALRIKDSDIYLIVLSKRFDTRKIKM